MRHPRACALAVTALLLAVPARTQTSPPAGVFMRAQTPAPEATEAGNAEVLDRVTVTESKYRRSGLDLSPFALRWLGLQWSFDGGIFGFRRDRMIVTATRTPQRIERVAATAHAFTQAELQATPAVTLDAALRSLPTFSLFRRSDSLTANPTAQGVSLRGLGPSGASRSLVLLDGIPLNDPFGGWVSWSKVPRVAVARIEIVPGGGGPAWGNSALGGTVQVLTTPPRLEATVIDRPPEPQRFAWRGTAAVTGFAGDFGLRGVSAGLTRPAGPGVMQVFGETFACDGFALVAPERRGAIDVPAWSRHRSVLGRFSGPAGPKAEFTATARGFEEFRGNGTPYQRNGSRERFGSAQLAAQPADGFTWTALGYVQTQSFASTFSAVNAGRTAETPASDQYAVPATALGASTTGTFGGPNSARTTLGADARRVSGETRERYNYSGGDFTRERVAGGTQSFVGLFALHERPLSDAVRATVGGRLDRRAETGGHRRERELADGRILRDDAYASETGLEFCPSLGVVWRASSAVRLHANAQRSFRRPTLNELYRPFRQGANITEANAALRTERATSGEVGLDTVLMRRPETLMRLAKKFTWTRTVPYLSAGATAFRHELRDAVANVTVARGPGTFPLFGPLPPGGLGRKRLNLEEMTVQGFELNGSWQPLPSFDLGGAYQYNDASVRRARLAPGLIGRRIAQVARHSARLSARWQGGSRLTFTARVRWLGRQFEDDENALPLARAVVGDVGATLALSQRLELYLNAENVGNARVETARSADGVVNVGAPRFVFGGVRAHW